MKYFYLFIFFLIVACKPTEKELTAQQIIDKSIAFSGAGKVANSQISFIFRDKKYIALRKKSGKFLLIRNQQKENIGVISDMVSNNGFRREINTHQVPVADSMATKYANSVNSVHYFSVLPYGLNDKAVKKKLLPPATIKGKEYYKVEITFSEDGGGEDFEDVFIYWIGKDDFLIDYLAYAYHTNGGGKRFRVLKEQCVKNGIRFVDYHNYKPLNNSIKLIEIDKAFEENQLKKVSEIVLKDIEVKLLDN
ncbi:DUF6503 family protein [Polaribacter sp.]|uniref:DUF6503 family protein n=1 Tax=Polaribacter sp. TaxID=1920175 RepID=UPI003F6AD442